MVLAFLAGWLAASGVLAGWVAGLSGALSNAAGWLDGSLGGVTDAAGVPAMVWIAGTAVAFGATTVLVALAVSALADLPSPRRDRA